MLSNPGRENCNSSTQNLAAVSIFSSVGLCIGRIAFENSQTGFIAYTFLEVFCGVWLLLLCGVD